MIIVYEPSSGEILHFGNFDPSLNVSSNHAYIEAPDGTRVENKKVNTATLELVDVPLPPMTWGKVRAIRNELLKSTDWAVLPDTPLNPVSLSSVQAYRQFLRDITETYSQPGDVVWPTKPGVL